MRRNLTMKRHVLRNFPTLCGAVLLCSVGFICTCARAQNATPEASPKPGASSKKAEGVYALYDFEKTLAAQIKTDPAKAVAAQQAWVAGLKKPSRDVIAVAAIRASSWLEKAGDMKGAWQVLQDNFLKMGGRPEGWWIVQAQVGLLRKGQKTAEAEALAKKYWQDSLSDGSTALVNAYVEVLEAQGKREEARAAMKDAFLKGPLLLEADHGQTRGGLYNEMIASLQRDGKTDEAISWAKLRFIEAPFNDKAIKDATNALTKALLAKDLSPVAVQGFLEAQQDPTKPNPLATVPLPFTPAEVTEALKAVPSRAKDPAKAHPRLNLLLAGGFHQEAMVLARQVLIENVGSSAGAEEICRVFKAMDLNLKRGNDFVAYLKTGEGTNPVSEYFKGLETAPAPAQP